MKPALSILFLILSTLSSAQNSFLESLEDKFNLPKIDRYEEMNCNQMISSQVFFTLHFKDSTTRIYNRLEDTISQNVFTNFQINPRCCPHSFIGKCNGYWYLLKEDFYREDSLYWNSLTLMAKFNAAVYDSIIQLDNNEYFGGFRKDTIDIFQFNKDSSFKKINEFHYIDSYIESSMKGVFLRQKNLETKKQPIIYLDYHTGLNTINFSVDSIYNKINYGHLLMKQEDKKYIYSFIENKVIESDFNASWVVPVYYFPIIFKDNYIAWGDDKWNRFNMVNPEKIEFIINGDFVNAIITNSAGEKFNLNLWNSKISKEN